jgi:hypothetical protein
MGEKKLNKIFILLLCLVLIRGLIYGLLIPADQFPDEFHHFKIIKAKQLEFSHADEQEKIDTATEIMYTIYYLRYPETTQQHSLDEFTGTKLPTPPSSLHLYYVTAAWLLNMFSGDIQSEFYLIRGISMLCGLFVVLLSYLSVRELFPENLFLVIGVPTLITFIPQFSAMNGAINNDKLAEVFTAFAFLLMIKIFRNGMRGRQGGILILLFGIIGLAILSKRSALFMLPVLVVFLFVYWWRYSLGVGMHAVLITLLIVMIVGAYAFMKNVSAIDNFVRDYIIWVPAYKIAYFVFRPELYTLDAFKQYLKFFIVMYWSFWGVFGYMTIHLHHFWYVAVAFVQLYSICGLLWFVRKVKTHKIVVERWRIKSLYLFGISIFFAVMLPFLRSNIFRGEFLLAQGRYLFPVLIPISILTLLGLTIVIPAKYHRLAGILGLLGLLVLDTICLSNYLLLNFHFIAIF